MKLIYSLSGDFYCDTSGYQYICDDDKRHAIYSKHRRGRVIAWLRNDGVIIAATSNSGDSLLDRLSSEEKSDVATLIELVVS